MSVIVSSGQQICNSPLNLSKSKQQYSFPKAQRFKSNSQQLLCSSIYELPKVKSRAAGFGYGTKSDFTKTGTKSPAPGWSMGLGREKMSEGGVVTKASKLVPGPGNYEYKPALGKISYSMRLKTKDFTKNPGPGQYEYPRALNSTGKYFNSRFQDSGASFINPPTKDRFQPINGPNKSISFPGPGVYQPSGAMSKDGIYYASNLKNSNCRTFGKEIRQGITKGNGSLKTPGPGLYRSSSEFGIYQNKNIKE